MKTLLLNPPSFENFDGGAGARWPARREILSFWYPAWLAYPAALIGNSRLLDAPPHGVTPDETIRIARDFDFLVLFTSTVGFAKDVHLAKQIKDTHPQIKIAFVGPPVSIQPAETLQASTAIDFVARREFDYSVTEFAQGRELGDILGISYRKSGQIVHNPDRTPLTGRDLDALPFVVDIYKRDLDVTRYNIPFLHHPFISLYTSRGCPAQCTFCLWPQTFSGHPWRTRSSENVVAELRRAFELFPSVKEYFFDDDTFAWGKSRVLDICRHLKPLNFTWSCNCRVHADYDMLKAMKDAGCRLLVVGFESGNPTILKNIKKGATVEQAVTFMKNCKSLGLTVHGDFIIGLPGETRESIQQTMRFAEQLDPETIQVSIAHAFPGTEFYEYVTREGYLTNDSIADEMGHQLPNLRYPGLNRQEIVQAVEDFYGRYYFRPRVIFRIVRRALSDRNDRARLYNEAREYLRLRAKRKIFTRSKAPA
ncbi:hopanoid biosynthesis associated radical SAM protein HpnJ [Desulforhabdus sp. TSK]|uniref:hopanoid biosynthesis associated radical SAM protein HpnJ n=1 Tax=Desulforhabdus sp. TSK TaxID=2925014 RepID=UPI001FC83A9A|nr:hopanoid biosynthesis associated radical SAM protein HpnJ [Desulforhabdus sp. TSK]GKT08292.1 hopanoid biosynthesis associated radical SAM protein HpnJ [Desulforhabdus sp. TSK]